MLAGWSAQRKLVADLETMSLGSADRDRDVPRRQRVKESLRVVGYRRHHRFRTMLERVLDRYREQQALLSGDVQEQEAQRVHERDTIDLVEIVPQLPR